MNDHLFIKIPYVIFAFNRLYMFTLKTDFTSWIHDVYISTYKYIQYLLTIFVTVPILFSEMSHITRWVN